MLSVNCRLSLCSQVVFSLWALSWLAIAVEGHKCVHDKIVKRVSPLRQAPQSDSGKSSLLLRDRERMLEAASNSVFRPIKIAFDFSNIESLNADTQAFIKDVLLVQTDRRFQSFLKVNGPTVIPAFTETGCDQMMKIPSSYAKTQTTADLLIFVGAENVEENYVAYASPCLLNGYNSRPNVGIVMINLKILQIYQDAIEKFVSVLLHEIIHILAFSPSLFEHFPITQAKTVVTQSRSTSIGSIQLSKIITPGVVSGGKKHLGCTSFDGIFVENEGGSASVGSHFEKLIAGNDLMTAEENGRMVLSLWTLNLLNDCGWYMVDLTKAENLDWGKNQGCGFLDAKCNTRFPNFCSTEGKMACSEDYIVKQMCLKQSFSDGCLIKENPGAPDCSSFYGAQKTALYESFGATSRCFGVNLNGQTTVGCYSSFCDSGVVKIKISNTTLSCNKTGDSLEYQKLKIVCPDANDFCSRMSKSCKNDCSGRGKCLESQECFCDFFTEGSDCSNTRTCALNPAMCSKIEKVSQELNSTISAGLWIVKSVLALKLLVFSQALK